MSYIGTCIDCKEINTIYKCIRCDQYSCHKCSNYYVVEDKWRCNKCMPNQHINVKAKELNEMKMDDIH